MSRLLAFGLAVLVTAGCATSAPQRTGSATILACASIDAWGSILAQLGGSRVHTVSIVRNPATDPHDYEPTPADAKAIALASVFVENGAGYDSWAGRTVRADPEPGRQVVNVAQLTGTPDDGNPHRWYSPTDVATVAAAITAALRRADPADAGYFEQRYQAFNQSGLADYHRLIASIRAGFTGVPVGASESVFTPLASALGLRLITPPSFLTAISEGADPSTADKATIDRQIADRQIEVYVYNSQNSTPDVAAQVRAAHRSGIPVVDVSETPNPAGVNFQDWQVRQLRSLADALAQAAHR